jgi:hypothetical protein
MKWLKARDKFLSEAKLRDVLLDPQKKRIINVWGEKYLDYEEIEATDRIKQGKWQLSEEDKDIVINKFFGTNYSWVREKLNSLPDKFAEVLTMSLYLDNKDLSNTDKKRVEIGFKGKSFNIKKLQISQISCLNFAIFRTLNAGETKADSIVVKGEDGRPLRDENNQIIKQAKEPGAPSFSNNIGNINTFISGYNSAYPDNKVDASIFTNSYIQNITNMISDNPDIIDFDLFGDHEMSLLIEHNAVNIMNMSVSKFYKSCQEMYFGGGHGDQYMRGLLINVFDPNTIPAFLVFNTPYYNKTEINGNPEKLSDVLPLCRLLIRSIEPFGEDSKPKLYFDKTYPDRMQGVLHEMIEKYSKNKQNDDYVRRYPFAPDIEIKDYSVMNKPYMDSLEIVEGTRIGRNTKVLYLSSNYDWSKVIIDKHVDIKELIIETPDIPKNFFDIKIKPNWVKFKYMKINDFSVFKNLITDSISLYQCSIASTFLSDMHNLFPDLKKLSLGNVEVEDFKEILKFKKLEELELMYTLSAKDDLESLLQGRFFRQPLNIKKITISGDLLKNEKNKQYLKKLKKNGITVLVKGLVL